MYVVVRRDLDPSQQAVQACHACIEAMFAFREQVEDHPHLVLLGVGSEQELLLCGQRLLATGIPYREFREPDQANRVTALATAPVLQSEARALRRYPLL